VRQAQKAGELPGGAPEAVLAGAVAAGILGDAEAEVVRRAAELRREVIQVDELSREEYLALGGRPPVVAAQPHGVG